MNLKDTIAPVSLEAGGVATENLVFQLNTLGPSLDQELPRSGLDRDDQGSADGRKDHIHDSICPGQHYSASSCRPFRGMTFIEEP